MLVIAEVTAASRENRKIKNKMSHLYAAHIVIEIDYYSAIDIEAAQPQRGGRWRVKPEARRLAAAGSRHRDRPHDARSHVAGCPNVTSGIPIRKTSVDSAHPARCALGDPNSAEFPYRDYAARCTMHAFGSMEQRKTELSRHWLGIRGSAPEHLARAIGAGRKLDAVGRRL